jgi:hypothetical protein
MWPVPLTRPPAIKERSLDLTTLALRNVWSEVDKDRMKFMGKVVSSLVPSRSASTFDMAALTRHT